VIKLSFCLHRLPHLTREQFQTYWFERHAPLVAKNKAALRIRRYIQSHTTTDPMNDAIRASREAPEGYDGVAELWWDSLEDIAAATSEPAGVEAGRELLEDERKFIDLKRSPLYFGIERPIIG
jgi:uncharacterized protein (TIGR02118 family)